ncbi:MAG: M10 family metallopeptidase C-terminal domain-containing protein [Hellea sp.]
MKYFDMLEISVATINFSYLDTVYDHEGLILDFGKFTQDNSYWGATLRDYSSLFGGEIINTFAMTGGRPTDALDWGTYLDGAGSTGTLDISIFLFPEGTKQITLSGTEYDFETVSWSEYEITQLVAVLEEMESYINVNFVTAADEDSANFVFALTDNLNLPGSALMLAPGAGSDPGFGIFDRSVNSWDTDGSGGLEIGGFSYRTLVHEIGHGLGLAHPHDSGGDSTIMNGVDDEDDTGDFQLNQGVFTAMGYVEGWDSAPYGPTNSTNYGDQGTFGTLDVAVLQAAYGANTSTGVGASTYTLSGSNQVGTHYRTIFDNGGADVFNYSGSRDAVFDLRAATLEYEDGGGGYVSHVDGIHGGFTIANGTVIENAVGGSGDDSFTGNAIGNYLSGNGGNDTFIGGAGSDLFEGGTGLDTVDFTDRIGIDWDINLDSNVGVARASGASSENDSLISIENVTLSDGDDIVELTFADNIIRGGGGTDRVVFSGASSDYTFSNTGQIDGIMISGEGNDTFYAVEEFEFSDGVFAWNNLPAEADMRPDLTIENVTLLNSTITQGMDATIFYDVVENNGFDAGRTNTGLYISTTPNFANAILLEEDSVIVNANERDAESELLNAIFSYDAGIYYLFVVADNDGVPNNETNENNNVSSPIVLTIELNNSGDINGTTGNDTLAGTNDNDVINGLAGNDILYGLGGDDSLNGGAGADRLTGGAGADMLIGGIGFDSVDYRSATSSVRFNVDSGGTLGDALGDTFSGIERYYLSDLSDIITGSSANEFFYGGGGNDQINGGGGIDRIYGGDGNDVQRGQDGNDLLFGSMGNDQLNGGAGFDIATYRTSTSRVVLNLGSGGTFGDAAGDTYFGVEAVYGSDFGDILAGNSSANELRGWDGDDILNGGGGNDRLFGGAGADALNGGLGIDIAVYTDASSRVTVNLVTLGSVGDAAGDSYSSVEWVWGSSFDDIITGDAKNNRLEGRSGNDTLIGGDGNDRLMGGDGNDTINGGNGVDTIYGQSGNDTLIGAGGNDFFFGSDGGDVIHGGLDFDTISYLASSSGVGVNLQSGGFSGEASGDTYSSIERVFGSSHEDHIVGSNEANTILGNGGHDYLEGGLGNDSLFGGAGIDSFGYNTTNGDNDVINDFSNSNEVIYFIGGDANFDTFTELQAMGTDSGGNVIFDFGGGNTLTVVGQNLADLSESNFVFNIEDPLIEVALFYMDSLI